MNATEIRRRAAELLSEAAAVVEGVEGSDEAPSAEISERHDSLVARAEGLIGEADALDARAARRAELAARMSQVGGPAPLQPHTDPGNTRSGRHQYSLIRAVAGQVAAIEGRGRLDGLELEVHQELAARRDKAPVGVLVPWDAPIAYRGDVRVRALDTATGAGAVPTVVAPTMIDVLRARMVLPTLGATVITDYSGPFSLPKTTATVTVGHVTSEGTNAAESNSTVGDIDFTYKSMEATTKLTRQFLNSANLSGETYAVDQITRAVASTLEGEAITGPGTTKRTKGLTKYTAGDGVKVLSIGAAGGNPTWAQIVSMTGMIDSANAPDDSRAWLLNPTTVAYFQSLPKVAGQPVFVLGESGLIAGYRYASTSQVPNNLTKTTGTDLSAMIFGAWSELLVALFTGADLYVDPFSAQPHVRVTVAQDFDVQLAHPESFALCVDLKTS